MGAFAEVLSIRPWEWYLLTPGETAALEGYLDRRQEAIEKASGG